MASSASAAVALGDNGFPTDENYADGVGTAKDYTVGTAAQDYAGQHLKLILSGKDNNGPEMGAVTAESVWLTGTDNLRFRINDATFKNVRALFLNGVQAWVRKAVTLPCDLTMGTGGSGNDSDNNYAAALFRIDVGMTIDGRTTIPAGNAVKVAADQKDTRTLSLKGGLSGEGELRLAGRGGTGMVCVVQGGDFAGTLGAYCDEGTVSPVTFTLDGAGLCPTLDMTLPEKGTNTLTVNVSQPMGLGNGSQLVAGRLNVTDLPGTEQAVFTVAAGATVTVGEGLTLNLPASAKPTAETGNVTYRLFDLSQGGTVEGALAPRQILFGGERTTCAVALDAKDGTLTLFADVPTQDASAAEGNISAAYADFAPAANDGSDAVLKLGPGVSSVAFGAPALSALTLDTSAGAPAALTLTGNLGAAAGVTLAGSAPKAVTLAPEAGQTLDLGEANASGIGAFNAADTITLDGVGTVRYHLGTLDEAAGKNLAAQIVAQGPGDYLLIDNGDDACMVFERFSVERPVITVKGGSALTLQARNFAGWDARQGSGAFLPGIVTLLEGGEDAAQTATLHRIPMPKSGGVCDDNLLSPIWFRGHATMTIAPDAKTNFYRSSDTEAMLKVFDGATARIAAPGAEPARMTVLNGAKPIVEVGTDATLTLDVVIASDNGGDAFVLRGKGETLLSQANTTPATLAVTEGAATLSGEGATWAGPVTVAGGATLRLAAGGTLPATAVAAEEGATVAVGEGGTLTLAAAELNGLSLTYAPTVAEGGTIRITLADEDYAKGTLPFPPAFRNCAEACVLIGPDGSELTYAVTEDGATLDFETPKAVSFALPTGWALDAPVWAEASVAEDATATTGYVNDATTAQTVGGRPAVVVDVQGSATPGTVLIGGYPYGGDEKTLSKDVWLKVSGGSHRYAIGGSDMQNYGGKPRHLSGNTVVNLSGGSVDYAYSCNLFDGKASTVRGSHALVIDGEAVLKGSAAAAVAIHGSGVTYSDVALNLTVRNLQSDNSASQGIGVSPGWTGGNGNNAGLLVGGGMSTRQNASHRITGDASVCVELPEGTEGAFSKTLVGGNYSTQGGGTSTLSGTASVSVSAPVGVTFDRDIVGGSRGTSDATLTTGASGVTLVGGTYTGTVTAGSLGTNAKTTGDATLTLDGADVSAATLQPGNVDGVATLSLRSAAAPKALGAFDVISSATPEAALTLPAANADLSQVTGTFSLDASAVETLTVRADAALTFTALPTQGIAVVCPAGTDRRLVCAVPDGISLEGMAFTVDGVAVEPALEGTTLTLQPAVEGPFVATVAADGAWGTLAWLNEAGERAVSFADALAAGATLDVTADAALALTGDVPGAGTLAVTVAEGATLTLTGAGKVAPTLALTGALTLAEATYAADVALADEASSLTLDIGHGSGQHANMLGKIAGPGELRIHATGGNWNAPNSNLFASIPDVKGLTGPVCLGNGTNGIRCDRTFLGSLASTTIVMGKNCGFQRDAAWRPSNGGSGPYLLSCLVIGPGSHLKGGTYNNDGIGRSSYTAYFNGPIHGASKAGEEPALFTATANSVELNGTITGDGVATGVWNGVDKNTSYSLSSKDNRFAILLIRNTKLASTSQRPTTVNAAAGALGGAAITFGTENGQANKSALNVNGDNTVASVAAAQGGSITLGVGVTLTVEGAAELTGLDALTVKVPDDYAGALLTPLTAETLTLDVAKVRVVKADGSAYEGAKATVLGGKTLAIHAPIVFENGSDKGLGAVAKALAEGAALEAGRTSVTQVRVLTGGTASADPEAVNGVVACFNVVPTCDAEGVVTFAYAFGIAAMRPAPDGATVEVEVTLQGGSFAEAVSLVLVDKAGAALEGVDPAEVAAGATAVSMTVPVGRLEGHPFRARAVKAEEAP